MYNGNALTEKSDNLRFSKTEIYSKTVEQYQGGIKGGSGEGAGVWRFPTF